MFPFDSISNSVSGAVNKAAQAGLKQAKRGKVVPRVNTERSKQRRQQQQTPSGVLSAQDMLRLFQAMPVPNRGYRNPNADQTHKLGTGFDQFLAKNPHIKSGPERQEQVNQEHWQNRQNAEVAARSAVAEAKARQAMPKEPPSSKYGTGSITYHSPGEARPMVTTTDPLTGQKVPLRSFLDDMAGVQATKYGPNAAQAGQDYFNPKAIERELQNRGASSQTPQQVPAAAPPAQDRMAQMNSDFDAMFANAPMAPPAQTQMGQMPEFSNPGMPLQEPVQTDLYGRLVKPSLAPPPASSNPLTQILTGNKSDEDPNKSPFANDFRRLGEWLSRQNWLGQNYGQF